MRILKVSVGDRVTLKKNHACGSNLFMITRVGSDVKIRCCNCTKELTMPRDKFDSSVRKIIINEEK